MFWASFFKGQTCCVRKVKQSKKKVSSKILHKTIEIEKNCTYCLFAIIIVRKWIKNWCAKFVRSKIDALKNCLSIPIEITL